MRLCVAAVLLIFCCSTIAPAQKTRYGQGPPKAKAGVNYPVKVHVSGIHLRIDCTPNRSVQASTCANVIYADAMLDGRKFELMGSQIWSRGPIRLTPADYQARLFKAHSATSQNPIGEEYELLLPDQTIWRCTVTGISE